MWIMKDKMKSKGSRRIYCVIAVVIISIFILAPFPTRASNRPVTARPSVNGKLQVINGQIGFYSFSGEAIPANKAYITLPAGTEVKSLGITFDNATAITDIANGKNGNGHCINLAGLRVNSTQKGIFIVNGKKVVVK